MYQQPGTDVPQSRGSPKSASLQSLQVLTRILGFETRKFEVLKIAEFRFWTFPLVSVSFKSSFVTQVLKLYSVKFSLAHRAVLVITYCPLKVFTGGVSC